MYLEVNEWSTLEYLYDLRFGRKSCRTYTISTNELPVCLAAFCGYVRNATRGVLIRESKEVRVRLRGLSRLELRRIQE